MHRTQQFLAGLAVSALSAGGFIGVEAALQGAAMAQTMSNAPNARSATDFPGRTINSWPGVRSHVNHATLLVSKPCDSNVCGTGNGDGKIGWWENLRPIITCPGKCYDESKPHTRYIA
jgi:hypothetical protein